MDIYGYYETDANHNQARFSRRCFFPTDSHCKIIGYPMLNNLDLRFLSRILWLVMEIRVTLFWLLHLLYVHSIGPINVPILRSISTKLTYVSTRNILKPTRSLYDFRLKSYGSNSGFHVFADLWPMFYFLSHLLGMMYWNLHAKFHNNPSSINGWYGREHTHKQTHTPKVINIVSQIPSGLD